MERVGSTSEVAGIEKNTIEKLSLLMSVISTLTTIEFGTYVVLVSLFAVIFVDCDRPPQRQQATTSALHFRAQGCSHESSKATLRIEC